MFEHVACCFSFQFGWAPAKDMAFFAADCVLSSSSWSPVITTPSQHEPFVSLFLSFAHSGSLQILHRADLPHWNSWLVWCMILLVFLVYLYWFLLAETFHRLGVLCQTAKFSFYLNRFSPDLPSFLDRRLSNMAQGSWVHEMSEGLCRCPRALYLRRCLLRTGLQRRWPRARILHRWNRAWSDFRHFSGLAVPCTSMGCWLS